MSHRLKVLQEALEEKLFPVFAAGNGEVARKGENRKGREMLGSTDAALLVHEEDGGAERAD